MRCGWSTPGNSGGSGAPPRRRSASTIDRPDSEPAGTWRPLAARQIEGEDEVVDAVGGADLEAHVDEDPLRRVGVGHRLDLDVADAVLVLGERLLDMVAHQRLRRGVVGGEDEVVDAAAPLGAHLPLAQRGADDDPHRLLDVALVLAELDAAVGPDGERELEADAEEIAHGAFRFTRSCAGDPDFDDPLAAGAGDDRAALPLLDLQAIGGIALGTDEAAGAAGVHRLDDLVPDRLEGGQAVFGVTIVHVAGPLQASQEHVQLDAASPTHTLSGGRRIARKEGSNQEGCEKPGRGSGAYSGSRTGTPTGSACSMPVGVPVPVNEYEPGPRPGSWII